MPQVLFYCPNCAFSKELSQSDIPQTANECICPSCKKRMPLSEAVKPLKNGDFETQTFEEIAIENQQDSIQKEDKSLGKYHKLMDEALLKLEADDDLEAMMLFEEAESLSSTPKARSYLAYCRAKIKFEFSAALKDCTQALKEEPRVADHYLNLSRIYLLSNKRGSALKVIRKGLKISPNPQLRQEFNKFEMRKSPIFSSLHRNHILNRNLGKFLSRLGIR